MDRGRDTGEKEGAVNKAWRWQDLIRYNSMLRGNKEDQQHILRGKTIILGRAIKQALSVQDRIRNCIHTQSQMPMTPIQTHHCDVEGVEEVKGQSSDEVYKEPGATVMEVD